MAVAHVSSSHVAATASVASISVNLDTTGARCGVIFAYTYGNSGATIFTSATIAGVNAPAVTGGVAADTATEGGNVKAYFLDNITAGASVAFTGVRTNSAVIAGISAIALSAASACEVYTAGIVLLQEDGLIVEQSVDDGSPGTNSLRLAFAYTGNATPAPVGANTTSIGSHDQTAFGSSSGRETTAGQGSRLVGLNLGATSDDRAAVHFAVRETPAAATSIPYLVMAPPRAA